MSRIPLDELLAAARLGLTRLDPAAARDAVHAGGCLIDIRTESQIAATGTIPGALIIPRNVLEWRLDSYGDDRHPHAPAVDDVVIVVCDQGYQSSLAAAVLQTLGYPRATDLAGGFEAWRKAGLPVDPPAAA
ncbi:MAG: rhodanese-like domain-containing protein [Actinomycetota bacterium]|nr:rhodanese-like domain-containing protein [Actinomycetota bacterium]